MKKTELFVFRHGETDWNRHKRCQGHTDIPLNTVGIRQAEQLAERIRTFALDAIVTSDLLRAAVTAEIVNQNLKLPVFVSQELRECTLGTAEGMHRDALIETYGERGWQKWISVEPEDQDFCFPGGESKPAHLQRLKNYLEEFCQTYPQYKRVGVSTHGGSVRRLIHLCEGAPAEAVLLHNCVLYRIELTHKPARWVFGERVE